MKRVLYLLLCLWYPLFSMGQAVRISDKPDQFMTDVQKLMATGGPAAVRAGTDLQSLFSENRLSAQQQERVMVLSRKMNQKRLPAATHFAPFYEALYHAIATQSAGTAGVDGLLTVAEKLFDTTDTKTFGQSLQTARQFLERRELYTGRYNKLYAQGGSFQFRFVDAVLTSPASMTGTITPADSAAIAKAAAERSRFDGWDTPAAGDSTMPKQLGVQYTPQRRPIPTVSGAVLTLTGVTLAIVANGDSALVSNTSGDLMLTNGQLVGKGGTVSWATADRPDISVTLTEYAMNVANPRLQADDVTLTYEGSKPVKGVFEYVSRKKSGPAQYPRFMSWQSDARIPNLGTDVDYRGGLALAGAQLVGSSASGQPALLIIKSGGKPLMKVSSRRFDFRDSTISAQSAAFVGYVDTDSITHPATQFKFDKAQRVAWFNREDRTGNGRIPFADSYHKFYIQPEVMRWDIPRKKIDFYQVGAKQEVPVYLESFDYFLPQRYADRTVDYGFHPLQIAANYVATKKTQQFTPEDLIASAKVNPTALRGSLNRMVQEGYLDRDANTGMLRLSRKGVLYVLAYAHKKDYDNFQVRSYFPSNDSLKNATINLDDKILTVRGVTRFTLSDSLKVFGTPSDKTLRIGKNRAFTLNGQIKAGTLRYAGRDIRFDYDKFSMNLNKVDSITFSSQKLAAQGKTGEVGGDIKYENAGTVYLAAADNKSGQIKGKKTSQRLVMPEGMTVYFNQPVRGNLTYNQKVYFKVPPIDKDSMGSDDISFMGTFYSDGIFPPFKAELKTMPDNTLGFVHKAPATGYPIYGSKTANVKFTSEITMDKNGLRAEGVLNHLTASLNTQGILFATDSLVTSGEKGTVKEGLIGQTYFPQVQLNDYSMKWWPKADSMVITTRKNNFVLYNATTNLEGGLVLRSKGLFGQGTLRRKDSEATSKSIKFNKDGFLADNAQFKVLSDKEGSKPILLGSDVDVDFNQVKGVVGLAINNRQTITDTLSSSLDFPFAAYKTNINKAQWNINAKTIAMKGDVKTSTFTATAEEQESLTFNGSAALYDVDKMMLNISGVPYVTSADARIQPDKGLVTIKRNGEMTPFKNARLELDTTSRFHHLKNGNIQVLSRTRFSGDATYLYPLAKGDTASVKMGNFDLQETAAPTLTADARKGSRSSRRSGAGAAVKTYTTVAKAEVDEDDNLQLAPQMLYKGAILMQASAPDLALDWFIKPALKKRADLISGWIPFKEKVAERLEIKVDKNLKNEGGQELVAGFHFRGGGAGLYPTFLSPKEDGRDEDLFTATGIMRYDEKDKLYRITSGTAATEAVAADSASDDVENAFTFNDKRGLITFKGAMNLLNSTPTKYLLASGSARINIDSSQYRFNTLLAFTFPVPEVISTSIATKLVSTNQEEQNTEAADDDLNRLSDKLLPLIGAKEVEAYRTKAQNQHVPLNQASPKLVAALVLANANLRWNDKFNAFYSTGQLGVSNMLATDINAQMDGFVEIRKSANGDEASIYLEASPDVWVFYDFKPGNGPGSMSQLAIISSDQEINDKLLAGSKNSAKATIEVVPATVDEKTLFVDRYLDQYKTKAKPAPKPKARPGEKVTKEIAKEKEKKKDKEAEKEGF